MSEPDIQKYADLMDEIKRRTSVIDYFATGAGHALYEPTTIESICLQLRKILELIAMGSLVANKKAYSKAHSDFAKHWNAKYLMRDVELINSDFYPKPIIENPSQQENVVSEWQDRPNDYLTKKNFIKVYNKCGAIMHAGNPYGSQIDYSWYEQRISTWREQVINLLNCHTIRLVDNPNIYLVHMKEEGDEKVHYYTFEPVPNK